MKRFLFIILAFWGSLVYPPALANTSVSPAALLGKWAASARHSSGALATTTVQFQPNMKFTYVAAMDGNLFMTASGTWKVSGQKLEWMYEESSHPAIQKGHVDVDEIQIISANDMTLKSSLSGRTHTFSRIR